MKKITFRNLIVLTSVTFFAACSSTSPKPKKLSTLEILGINQGTHIRQLTANILDEKNVLPMAKTYPLESTFVYAPVIDVQPKINIQAEEFTNYIPDTSMVVNEVEDHAKRLLGIKYVWGATGPYTYDCSGFTQKIYADAGINIPRVSRDQARVGQFISYNNLRKGDMVFFDTKKRRSGKVSHVGIYLGNGNFIHASSAAKKIVIYNFNEKTFYKKRFLWGRRVIRDNYFMASL